MMATPVLAIAAAGTLYLIVWALHASRIRGKLPPGPTPLPVIGNLHQAPASYPWRVFRQWAKQYGPIFSVRFGLNTVIVLNTHQAAQDLLDKRGNIYSSRPHLMMATDIVSKGNRPVLMPYSARYRAHQRLFMASLNNRMSRTYRDLQDIESKQLVYDFLTNSDYSNVFHRYASSVVYTLAYGRRMLRTDAPEVETIGTIMQNFGLAIAVGAWIVDAVPVLNRLPVALAPWKRTGNQWHDFESKAFLSFMESGLATDSWNLSKEVSANSVAQGMSPIEKAYNVGSVYEAGSDTTTVALEIFLRAIVLYPNVMRKAQAEIDEVVGGDRMPEFEDADKLVYINAMVKEVLRWRPTVVGGVPHSVTQDDEYMGYKIPKGATIIPNHWSMCMDEETFSDPFEFRPERYVNDPDLPISGFGFGRRVCTGQVVAKNSLLIVIARLLWAFNIEEKNKKDGTTGESEDPSLAFTDRGLVSRPLPFEAIFTIRDQEREKIVRREWQSSKVDADTILNKIRAAQLQK